MQDTKGSVVLHPEWGVGLDDIDLDRRTKKPVFLKKMIREESMMETLAEEMRVLYVALTPREGKTHYNRLHRCRRAVGRCRERGDLPPGRGKVLSGLDPARSAGEIRTAARRA